METGILGSFPDTQFGVGGRHAKAAARRDKLQFYWISRAKLFTWKLRQNMV